MRTAHRTRMKIIYEQMKYLSEHNGMFLMITRAKRERVSVLEAETAACVCTAVGGLISVLVLKVIVHQVVSTSL